MPRDINELQDLTKEYYEPSDTYEYYDPELDVFFNESGQSIIHPDDWNDRQMYRFYTDSGY